MHTKKLWSAFVVGLLLVGWGTIDGALAGEREVLPPQHPGHSEEEIDAQNDADAQVVISESLANQWVSDVYRVSCTSSSARCIRISVADDGPFFDTNFKAVASVPGSTGVVTRLSGIGGHSTSASTCRNASFSSHTFTGVVIVQEANNSGVENYHVHIECTTSGGSVVGTSVTKILDQ